MEPRSGPSDPKNPCQRVVLLPCREAPREDLAEAPPPASEPPFPDLLLPGASPARSDPVARRSIPRPRSQRGSALGRILVWTAAVALVLLVVSGLYRAFVPSTSDRAEAAVRASLGDLGLRLVIAEAVVGEETPFLTREGTPGPAALVVERLDSLEHRTLDRSDAEIFQAERLAGEAALFYDRRAAEGDEVLRIDPGAFRARGPALKVVLHPWRRAGEPLELSGEPVPEEPGGLRSWLPVDGMPGGALSLRVTVEALEEPVVLRCQVGGEAVPLYPVAPQPVEDGSYAFLSARFEAPAGAPVEVVLQDPAIPRDASGRDPSDREAELGRPRVELFGWER